MSVKFTPVGRAPLSPITMEAPVGNPVVCTVKAVAAIPGAKVTLLALVIWGGSLTVMETVAAEEVRGAAQVELTGLQPSGLPRSVTVNWKESGPVYPALGV